MTLSFPPYQGGVPTLALGSALAGAEGRGNRAASPRGGQVGRGMSPFSRGIAVLSSADTVFYTCHFTGISTEFSLLAGRSFFPP